MPSFSHFLCAALIFFHWPWNMLSEWVLWSEEVENYIDESKEWEALALIYE
jgi:hypothetical protein